MKYRFNFFFKFINIIICLTFFRSLSAQDTICVKGLVIIEDYVLPDTKVTNLNTKTYTYTNFKGLFKIECKIGDTLLFYKSYGGYKPEKYIVCDDKDLLVKLIHEIKFDKDGKHDISGSVTGSIRSSRHTIEFSGSFLDKKVYSCGYNYTFRPFFPEEDYIPVRNQVSIGTDFSMFDDRYYVFPHIGFDVRSAYHSNYGFPFYISFFVPTVQLGYWMSDLQKGRNGFGYKLGTNLIYIDLHQSSLAFNLGLNYTNYLTPDGTFLIYLKIFTTYNVYEIPKFIKKQISK